MKRHNIYLYNCDKEGCKAVGFSRIDVHANGYVKIALNINESALGIRGIENVEIIPKILKESGNIQRFSCDNASESLFDFVGMVEYDILDEIVGLDIEIVQKSGITTKLRGMLPGRKLREPDFVVEEKVNNLENKVNKITIDKLTTLPRKYWHLVKNRFFICNCNRYGYFGYIKNDNDYIICVPGSTDEKTVNCGRKYGFTTCLKERNENGEVYYLCQENRK